MAGKQLESGSKLEDADLDGDGIITDAELDRQQRILEMEDADAMRDAQRRMAWFALFGMLLYPFAVVMAVALGLDQAATVLGSMAATYFVSVAAIVAAFFGGQAYAGKKASTPSSSSSSSSGSKPRPRT